jgi:protein-disulfide isomerase
MQVNYNVVWALVSGVAVGYIFGNALPLHGGGSSSPSSSTSSASTETIVPTSEAIPADWLSEKDIGASDVFSGLTSSQRYLALKVLNTKPCDCGCPHGSIARCKKDDPGCPVAPKEIEIAAREARAGKTYDEIYAAVQKPSVMPAQQGAAAPSKPHRIPLADSVPVRGPKNAKITIVMWSDFQCPFCGRVEPTLKQVVDTYGKDVRIAWHNFPLPFHDHAQDAAEAAMAADAQGKFWAMHDKLFQNQQSLDRASLDRFAGELGLDMAKYKAVMDGQTYKDKIAQETQAGSAVGVNGTPAFFINGVFLNGAVPFADFKRIIDAELEKANALLKAGTPPDKIYDAEMNAITDDTAGAPGAAGAPGSQ